MELRISDLDANQLREGRQGFAPTLSTTRPRDIGHRREFDQGLAGEEDDGTGTFPVEDNGAGIFVVFQTENGTFLLWKILFDVFNVLVRYLLRILLC